MSFDIVCFDCDSTLSKVEGIDELARRSGRFKEIAAMTLCAMNGELALEAVYRRRLELIKPDRASVEWLARLYIDEMVDGVRETMDVLQRQSRSVHIISGGLRQAILPLAMSLNIPDQHVHAVDIAFNPHGDYLNFDGQSPLARSGGKAEICRQLRNDRQSLVMIGDGTTDLEAKQAGATVIGFGGVVARDSVRDKADYFVNGSNLASVLEFLN